MNGVLFLAKKKYLFIIKCKVPHSLRYYVFSNIYAINQPEDPSKSDNTAPVVLAKINQLLSIFLKYEIGSFDHRISSRAKPSDECPFDISMNSKGRYAIISHYYCV